MVRHRRQFLAARRFGADDAADVSVEFLLQIVGDERYVDLGVKTM